MRTINKMRAELVYNEYNSNDCRIAVNETIKEFLKKLLVSQKQAPAHEKAV